jgi:hypothetical protein
MDDLLQAINGVTQAKSIQAQVPQNEQQDKAVLLMRLATKAQESNHFYKVIAKSNKYHYGRWMLGLRLTPLLHFNIL